MGGQRDLFSIDIQYVKGVGPKRAELFSKLGIDSVGALLQFYPRAYIDLQQTLPLSQAPFDAPCAVLGRVVRNLAINRWRRDHAQKRYAGLEALFSELEECIPSGETAERQLEEGELTQVLNDWLASLSQSDRVLFLRRYWNGEPLKELEQAYGLTHSALAKRMYRLRGSLRKTLEREGYTL